MSTHGQSESAKTGRKQRMKNDLALLSMAITSTTAGTGLKHILCNWKNLRKLPTSELAYYSIVCKQCAPVVHGRGYRQAFISHQEPVSVAKANTACVQCGIIRHIAAHFFCKYQDLDGVEVESKAFPNYRIMQYDLSACGGGQVLTHLYFKETSNPITPCQPVTGDICIDPASNALAKKVNGWIHECVTSHGTCESSIGESLRRPKRLLRLGDRPCLSFPVGQLRYAALSYCWGTYNQHITLKANVTARHGSINTLELPQTLKDAIWFTEKLGIKYIWIDALCIVQDDEKEWAKEASRMADIYQGAYVVLAATRAKGVTEGFLQHRSEHYRFSKSLGTKRKLEVRARADHDHLGTGRIYLGNQPLTMRGWCLQETLLAPRIVHFLPSEVFYRCKSTAICECDLHDKKDDWGIGGWPPSQSIDNNDKNGLVLSIMWVHIVEDCSKRQFTYPDDVLPALSGLAQLTAALRPGRYIAGMWGMGIALQLGWFVASVTTAPVKRSIPIRPTFSWITVPGQVRYDTWHFQDASPICTLVRTEIMLATTDPFGKLRSASIALRGKHVSGAELVSAISNNMSDIHFSATPAGLGVFLKITIDWQEEFTCEDELGRSYEGLDSAFDWSTVTCFGLYSSKGVVAMLLLRHSLEENAYIRVGLARNVPKVWFDAHVVDSTLTIV